MGGLEALRFALPHMEMVKLTDVYVVPVCASTWLVEHSLATPADLVSHTLVRANMAYDGWKIWGDAHGLSLPGEASTVDLDGHMAPMRTVEQGLGVGLAMLPLMSDWIRRNGLLARYRCRCNCPSRPSSSIRLAAPWRPN